MNSKASHSRGPKWTLSATGPSKPEKPRRADLKKYSPKEPLIRLLSLFEKKIRLLLILGLLTLLYGQTWAVRHLGRSKLEDPFEHPGRAFDLTASFDAQSMFSDLFEPLSDASGGCGNSERKVDEIQFHVLGWRRRESLGALLGQLENSDYGNWDVPVPLHIHLDGEASEDVMKVADKLEWSHGPKHLDIRTEQTGLRNMWLTSMAQAAKEAGDNTLLLCFEDDLQVSKDHFQWLLALIDAYGRNPDCRDSNLMGFSLSPNRIEEMRKPFTRWDARQSPGLQFAANETRHAAYLSALPGSWGAAYWSDRWNEFAKFTEVRMSPPYYDVHAEAQAEPGHYDDLQLSPRELFIPDARSNVWPKSWKRFMVDFMYARGAVMLYPNLPRETGFASTLALKGEHVWSTSKSTKSQNLRVAALERTMDISKLGVLPSYADLRVLDLHLEPTTRESLAEDGIAFLGKIHDSCSECDNLLSVWATTEKAYRSHTNGSKKPPMCFPDLYMPASAMQNKPSSSRSSQKYLLMEPQFGANNQIFAIVEGLFWAWTLGRQLVLPPIFVPRVKDFLGTLSEEWPRTEDLFELMIGDDSAMRNRFKSLPPPLPPIGFHEWNSQQHSVPRIVRLARDGIWDKSTYILMTELETRSAENTTTDVVEVDLTHLFEGKFPTSSDLQHYFGGCDDDVLAFQGIYFVNVKGFDKYSAMQELLSLAPRTKSIFSKVKTHLQEMLGSDKYMCMHVRYGDFGPMCNAAETGTSGIKFYDKLAEDGFSCGVTPEQVRHVTQTYGLPALVMSDSDAALSSSLADLPMPSVSSEWVKRAVVQVVPTMGQAQLEVLSVALEQELCSEAEVSVLNRFSTFSKRVQYMRKDSSGETLFWKKDM